MANALGREILMLYTSAGVFKRSLSCILFYFILLGAISLAFKDIVSERKKRFELLEKKHPKPSATQPAFLYIQNKQTKKKGFFS